MAELASLTALGGVVGDTFGAFEIQVGGVLANRNYVWKEKVATVPPTYNAAWIGSQAIKSNYAAALLAPQGAMITSSKVTALAAGQTGVKYFDLSGSATLQNGIYLERGGSYLPGVLPPGLVTLASILIPFSNTIATNGSFSIYLATTGAVPFWDFSDGTTTVQTADNSGSPTVVTGASPRVTTLRLLAAEVGLLTVLYLNNNQITTIPSQIGSLTALTYLYLNNNQITTIPSQIGSLTALTYLDLNSNQITTIPSQIGSLTALTYLDLNSNQITAAEIIAFAQLVAANSAWDNCVIALGANPGSAAAAVDAGFIAAKATLESRGCTVTI
jgi:hypothetical protein